MTRAKQLAMAVAWPAFLMAGVLEVLVFSVVDPSALHVLSGAAVPLSPTAVYSLAFFVFWLVIVAAGAMSLLLAGRPADINRRHWR
jgi:hypothetical protein